MVARRASTSSRMRCSIWGQIEPDALLASEAPLLSGRPGMSVISSTGTAMRISSAREAGGLTMRVSCAPPRNCAMRSTGRTVAERPMRCAGWGSRASSRSRLSASCAPRLPPATACTSSRISVVTPRSASRARDVSIKNSDSGVVIRISGGVR